eukprot:TRINITY_DN5300_c0_g2_i18.p3 TRINITY_DN5300_c0_g2~~TRINITY_DN5300_c0_g2_i18.p3  ORF type:complete len:128 (-),score=16.56 TRINITY_DN5300_c0_g2_i18:387-770(-)
MITAGDTTPSALNSIFYLLSKHPHIQEKLRSEILKYITDDNFTIKHISSCKYLQMYIKESLRILPPVAAPVPRRCVEPFVLAGSGVTIPEDVCFRSSREVFVRVCMFAVVFEGFSVHVFVLFLCLCM